MLSNRRAAAVQKRSAHSDPASQVCRQIKSRTRVRDLAEVYTHDREVTAMLDFVNDQFPSANDPGNHDRRFLEPACGSGNFLEEILRRKLGTVTTKRYRHPERYEHRILRCLASIYGIDIDRENITETRKRLRTVIASHFRSCNAPPPSVGFISAVETILSTNIIRADSLTDARRIKLVAYTPGRGVTFVRKWFFLEEPIARLELHEDAHDGNQKQDATAVHYADLAANPKPVKPLR